MADQGEKTQKKKSFLSKVGSVTVGFTPNMYGETGGAKLKKREGIPAPDHLRADACRAMYIPKHNGSTKGMLPIHVFTQDYRDKLRDENIGSDKWRYTFSLMGKPRRDDTDSDDVAYLMEVEDRTQHGQNQNLTVCSLPRSLPAGNSKPFTFTTSSSGVRTVTMSHHVPPVVTKVNTEAHLGCPNPWFTITATDSPTSSQWQIHPVEHGPLQYTLIELPSAGNYISAVQPENQHLIRAIYHNVGVGTSFGQPFSEGVLLLPTGKIRGAELETTILTSLIGLLWGARETGTVKVEVPNAEHDTKPKSKKSGGCPRSHGTM